MGALIPEGRGPRRSGAWSRGHADQGASAAAKGRGSLLGRVRWRRLYPDAPALRPPLLEFLDFQYKEKPVGFGFPVHAHSRFTEFYYLDRGALELTLGRRRLTLGSGQAALIPAGLPHAARAVSQGPCDVLTVHFQLGAAAPLPPAARVLEVDGEARAFLGRLLAGLGRRPASDAARAALGWLAFLGLLEAGPRGAPAAPRARATGFPSRVESLARERLGERLTLAGLARQLGVSVSTLAHRYRQEAGASVKQDLLRWRVERAGELLRQGAASVKEVAQSTGFASSSALAAAFRERTGLSPSAYARSLSPRLGLHDPGAKLHDSGTRGGPRRDGGR